MQVSSSEMKILCVDDSQDNCDLVSFILSEAGYEIKSAQTITEGLRLAQGDDFQLYLLDLAFTDGSGLELIEKIREFDATTPIVVCSGDVREAVQTEALQLGAKAYLTKPVNLDALVETIGTILNQDSSKSYE